MNGLKSIKAFFSTSSKQSHRANDESRKAEPLTAPGAKINGILKRSKDSYEAGQGQKSRPSKRLVHFTPHQPLNPEAEPSTPPQPSPEPPRPDVLKSYGKQALYQVAQGADVPQDLIGALTAAVLADPLDIEALSLRMLAARATHHTPQAITDADAILAIEPDHRLALLHRAAAWNDPSDCTHISQARFLAAIRTAKAWSQAHPNDRFGAMIYATWLTNTEEAVRASVILENLIKDLRSDIDLLSILLGVQCYIDMTAPSRESVAKTIQVAKDILNIDPKNKMADRVLNHRLNFVLAPKKLCPIDVRTNLFTQWPLARQDHQVLVITQPGIAR